MAQFAVGAQVLADSPFNTRQVNWAFFCPKCCTIWATIDHKAPIWGAITRNCERERDLANINGSLFQDFNHVADILSFIRRYPKLLQHEFRCHMRWAEATIKGSYDNAK